jgi:hypothetical protein
MAWPSYWPMTTANDIQVQRYVDDVDYATSERVHATTGGDNLIVSNYHTAGDYIQNVITYQQNTLIGYLASFTAAALIDASLPYSMAWTFNDYSVDHFFTTAGLNAAGFTRTYPKSIVGFPPDSPTDLTLVDGSTAVEGDKAIYVGEGQVYQVTSGSWVLLGNVGIHKPDTTTIQDVNGTEPGDYLTTTVMNESRKALNALVWVVHGADVNTSLSPSAGETRYGIGGGTGSSLAAAKVAADASYAAAAVDPTIEPNDFGPHTLSSAYGGGSSFVAELSVYRLKYDLVASGANAWLVASAVDFYSYIMEYPHIPPDSIGTRNNSTYDANGTGWTARAWNLTCTDAASSATTRTSAWIGNNPNTPYHPAWVGTAGSFGDEDYKGFGVPSLGVSGAVMRFDVAGGFLMRP